MDKDKTQQLLTGFAFGILLSQLKLDPIIDVLDINIMRNDKVLTLTGLLLKEIGNEINNNTANS